MSAHPHSSIGQIERLLFKTACAAARRACIAFLSQPQPEPDFVAEIASDAILTFYRRSNIRTRRNPVKLLRYGKPAVQKNARHIVRSLIERPTPTAFDVTVAEERSMLSGPERWTFRAELKDRVRTILKDLSDLQIEIIRSRYLLEPQQTLRQIGKRLGMRSEAVRIVEAKALRILRHPRRAKILFEFSDQWQLPKESVKKETSIWEEPKDPVGTFNW